MAEEFEHANDTTISVVPKKHFNKIHPGNLERNVSSPQAEASKDDWMNIDNHLVLNGQVLSP